MGGGEGKSAIFLLLNNKRKYLLLCTHGCGHGGTVYGSVWPSWPGSPRASPAAVTRVTAVRLELRWGCWDRGSQEKLARSVRLRSCPVLPSCCSTGDGTRLGSLAHVQAPFSRLQQSALLPGPPRCLLVQTGVQAKVRIPLLTPDRVLPLLRGFHSCCESFIPKLFVTHKALHGPS